MQSRVRQYFKGGGQVLSIKLVDILLTYGSITFYAYLLPTSSLGYFLFATNLAVLLGQAIGLGFPQSSLRFFSEYRATGRLEEAKGYLLFSSKFTFIAGCVVLFVGILLLQIPGLMSAGYQRPAVFALALAGVWALALNNASILRCQDYVAVAFLVQPIIRGVPFVAIGLFVLVSHATLAYTLVLAVTIVTALVLVGFQALWISNRLPKGIKASVPPGHPKYWTSVALPLWAISSVQLFVLQGGVVLLGFSHTDPETVALYGVAARVSLLTLLFLQAENAFIAPKIAAYYSCGEIDKLQRLLNNSRWRATLPSVAVFMVIVLFSHQILSLFGHQYQSASTILIILALGPLVSSATGAAGNILSFTSLHWVSLRVHLLFGTLYLVAAVVAVSLYGAVGMAVVSAFFTAITKIVLAFYSERKLGLRLWLWKLGGKSESAKNREV